MFTILLMLNVTLVAKSVRIHVKSQSLNQPSPVTRWALLPLTFRKYNKCNITTVQQKLLCHLFAYRCWPYGQRGHSTCCMPLVSGKCEHTICRMNGKPKRTQAAQMSARNDITPTTMKRKLRLKPKSSVGLASQPDNPFHRTKPGPEPEAAKATAMRHVLQPTPETEPPDGDELSFGTMEPSQAMQEAEPDNGSGASLSGPMAMLKTAEEAFAIDMSSLLQALCHEVGKLRQEVSDLRAGHTSHNSAPRRDAFQPVRVTPKDVRLKLFWGAAEQTAHTIDHKYFLPLLNWLRSCQMQLRASQLPPELWVATTLGALRGAARASFTRIQGDAPLNNWTFEQFQLDVPGAKSCGTVLPGCTSTQVQCEESVRRHSAVHTDHPTRGAGARLAVHFWSAARQDARSLA
jgi:hypothetical protein